MKGKAQGTKSKKQIAAIAKNIKLLILDVDGVLTDGRIILDNEGNEFKAFNVRDGHGIKMLEKAGIKTAIITGRHSKVVERRAHELGITEVYQRCHIKSVAYEHLIEKMGLTDRETAYVGDDIVDIPLFMRVGLSVAVADAIEEAKAEAMLVTKNRGGMGAVREVCDLILKSNGKWKEFIDEYYTA
ncbi:MAG: 3-deoxy-manno-octulosonate-8-phosphatase KdsC [Nitrospirae bacterium]|nr:3-deoxy-manno-octulosonate-8-phosphatase KdsC [Nitrospirota bacterium]MCL5977390.1 3-deoxy-manno-octulosonate-8-phosphatase KdsC [Nitrospirota bacterium]